MRIASLGSGSRGNATLVQHNDTLLLVDNGFSLKQFGQRLRRLGIEAGAIDALLLTHEHGDHSGGAHRLCESHAIPLWTTMGTARAALPPGYPFQCLLAGRRIAIGDIDVLPVTVPHDANEPLQFVFEARDNGRRLGLLTDAGHITRHIVEAFDGVDGLLLEFNYDRDMLENGPYPEMLKRRVGGDHGHLSNEQSLSLLQRIDTSRLACLVAAHISEKNNLPEIVDRSIRALDGLPPPILATQNSGFDWLDI